MYLISDFIKRKIKPSERIQFNEFYSLLSMVNKTIKDNPQYKISWVDYNLELEKQQKKYNPQQLDNLDILIQTHNNTFEYLKYMCSINGIIKYQPPTEDWGDL